MSGYWKQGKGEEMSEAGEKYVPKETVKDIDGYKAFDIPERGIRKETLERFGVKVAVSQEDGKTPIAVYFPSHNQKDIVTGYKKQDLSKSKEEKYHWSTVGVVNIKNKMFGQTVAEGIQRKRSNLTCLEGEWDAISVFQAQVDQVKGTKFEGMEPSVVSIPMGTANAVESVIHNKAFVESYPTLTIMFDSDEATAAEKSKGIMKGLEARHAVAGALSGNGQSLMTVTPPPAYKDASDMLQAGKSDDLAKLVQFEKRPYSPEKVVGASSVSFEEFIKPREAGVFVDCFPDLMKKLNGFRLKELTLFLAPSNAGKSTVCSVLAHKFMQAGHKIGMIFLEENNKESLQRIVAAELKVNYLKFMRDPTSVASIEEIRRVYDDITSNNRMFMLDHFGSIPVADLLNKIKHMVLAEGCKYVILDHISGVISGLASDNERKDLDVAMTHLAAFCAAHEVHLLVVSHINRSDSQQFLPPKGKEGEPFWVNVRKESARGSAALEQFSWNIIALEPEINPDFTRGRVRLKVLKTRFGDSLGIADVFTLDNETWEVVLDEGATTF